MPSKKNVAAKTRRKKTQKAPIAAADPPQFLQSPVVVEALAEKLGDVRLVEQCRVVTDDGLEQVVVGPPTKGSAERYPEIAGRIRWVRPRRKRSRWN